MGEIFERLTSDTSGKNVEETTSPHQYSLKTKTGCERISSMLQSFVDFDYRATKKSVHDVGVFDSGSRVVMLKLLPFIGIFD